MDTILLDLHYAWKSLRRHRRVAFVILATLSTGIAAMTTVFSILNAGFLRPLPYPDADRLIALSATVPGRTPQAWTSTPGQVVAAAHRSTSVFERVAAFVGGTSVLADSLGAVRVQTTEVDTVALSLLGARAEQGRLFTSGEIASHAPLILISDSLWRSRFRGESSMLGRVVHINGTSRTVVGVLASGFRFDNSTDVWMPLAERSDSLPVVSAVWYGLIAKRNKGTSLAQARRETTQIANRLGADDPLHFQHITLVVRGSIVDRGNSAALILAALFLLLTAGLYVVACANVANLSLARAAERRQEMAIRGALGATRSRLVRQGLTESALLAAASGVIGGLAGTQLLRWVVRSIPTRGFPGWLQFGPDWRVVVFVTGTTVGAVLIFGLAPALETARFDLLSALKEGGAALGMEQRASRRRARGVMWQVALSFAALVSGLTLARSYFFLTHLDRGYDAADVAEVRLIHVYRSGQDARGEERLLGAVRARMSGIPGASAVALAGPVEQLRDTIPASGRVTGIRSPLNGHIFVPEEPEVAADRLLRPIGRRRAVTDNYFALMGIRVFRGRGFGIEDQAGGTLAAVVSERIARTVWPSSPAVGKTFRLGSNGPLFTVVGVARDVRDPTGTALSTSVAPWPDVYFSARQVTYDPTLYIRVNGDPGANLSTLESTVHAVDANASVSDMRTLADVNGGSQRVSEVLSGLATGIAVCGALLALLGVYSVVAYGVAHRRREIGLRIALGANSAQVVALFIRESGRHAIIGLGIGSVLAAGLSVLLRAVVWGVSASDPSTYFASAVGFGAVIFFSCWIPARRATLVEPLESLRSF